MNRLSRNHTKLAVWTQDLRPWKKPVRSLGGGPAGVVRCCRIAVAMCRRKGRRFFVGGRFCQSSGAGKLLIRKLNLSG
jgi:hypothetical protein